MYKEGMGSMGAIDWGGIINSGIGAVSNILGPNYPSINPSYPANYPGSYVQDSGSSLGDLIPLAAVGIGAFLIVSMMSKKRRR